MSIAGQIITAVAIFVFMPTAAFADEPSLRDIRQSTERAEQLSKELNLPKNAPNKKAEETARRAAEIFHSDEFQTRVETMRDRIQREMFGDTSLPGTSETEGIPKGESILTSSERLYLFISSSMPKTTLRRYVADLDRISDTNATMVLRGFVGGMEKAGPTLKFVSSILLKDEDCEYQSNQCDMFSSGVQIDPMLFRRYGIERVPAVVYATGISTHNPGSEGLKETVSVENSYVVYGDASLDYLLELIHHQTGNGSLKAMITGLREGFFDEER